MSSIIQILSSAILDYMDGNHIKDSMLEGLNIPEEKEEDDGEEREERKDIPTDFSDLDSDIVFAIFKLVCYTVFEQANSLQNQFFLYLKWAIFYGKSDYMRSLDIRDAFTRFALTQRTSIAQDLLHILAIIEIARNKKNIVGKSARELYDMHFEIYHTLALDSGDVRDFSRYVSSSPYLHIFLLRYFTMHSIPEVDMGSIKYFNTRPDRIFDIHRVTCPAFKTLIKIYDCKLGRQSSELVIPKREIVPVVVSKLSQRERKKAAALAKETC